MLTVGVDEAIGTLLKAHYKLLTVLRDYRRMLVDLTYELELEAYIQMTMLSGDDDDMFEDDQDFNPVAEDSDGRYDFGPGLSEE